MKLFFTNLKKVLTNSISILTGLISTILFLGISTYFSNIPLMIGNMGYFITYLLISLNILIGILFGIFVGASVYKIRYFNSFDKKGGAVGGIGSFFGILVTGCPSCSITVASYLGLGSLFTILPFYGLELKVVGLLILGYSVYNTIKNLETCSMKKEKKKKKQ